MVAYSQLGIPRWFVAIEKPRIYNLKITVLKLYFLGVKVFTGYLVIFKLQRKVPVVDFDACLTFLIFHFTSS